ncbi:MAG: TetR/AcrR family transcriptional regulator [Candidatus Marinimicrobia bacterium]|nr:TetR/AcrR family transcriptional regulator [Candidatus Neomarinimicrobiota bacterium]
MKNKRDQKKQTILAVAQKFFSRFGFNKTTMDEIAKAARMGKATLYHYFRDKEQLFYEVVRNEAKTMQDAIANDIQDITDPKERLRVYMTVRIEYLNKFAIAYSALRDEYLEYLPSIKKFRADFIAYEMRVLTSIFQDGVDKKIFSIINIHEIVKIFIITLRGIEISLIADSGLSIDKQQIDLLTNMMLFGICK